MILEIDENSLAKHLDGMKSIADSNNSVYNEYPKMYNSYIRAYSEIGLYITCVKGKHVVLKSDEL